MSKKKNSPTPLSLNEELVIYCAMRYALGRKTYVVGAVCDELRRNHDRLPVEQRRRIAREIQEYQDQHGMAGMDFDNDEWNKVKWLFDDANRVRIRANRYGTDIWEEHTAAKGGGKYWSIPDMLEFYTVEEIQP